MARRGWWEGLAAWPEDGGSSAGKNQVVDHVEMRQWNRQKTDYRTGRSYDGAGRKWTGYGAQESNNCREYRMGGIECLIEIRQCFQWRLGRGFAKLQSESYPKPDGESKKNCKEVERNLAAKQIEIRAQSL